jgi:hypothetical protein
MIDVPVVAKDEDEVAKTLRDVGVDYYTHRNENIIAENVVEAERMKLLFEVGIIRYSSVSGSTAPDKHSG